MSYAASEGISWLNDLEDHLIMHQEAFKNTAILLCAYISSCPLNKADLDTDVYHSMFIRERIK